MLDLYRTITNRKAVKTQSELIASVAVLFVWLALLAFVCYSIIDRDSILVYITIPIAVGALGISATLGVFALVVGKWEEVARRRQQAEVVAQKRAEKKPTEGRPPAVSGLVYQDAYKPIAPPSAGPRASSIDPNPNSQDLLEENEEEVGDVKSDY